MYPMNISDSESNGYFYDPKSKDIFMMSSDDYEKYEKKRKGRMLFLYMIAILFKAVSLPENLAFSIFLCLVTGVIAGVISSESKKRETYKYHLMRLNLNSSSTAFYKKEILKKINIAFVAMYILFPLMFLALFFLPLINSTAYYLVVYVFLCAIAFSDMMCSRMFPSLFLLKRICNENNYKNY